MTVRTLWVCNQPVAGWLEIMKAFLQDSENSRDTSNATDVFVKKIRDLAFRIEDVVDEFKYKLEDGKHGGFSAKTKKRIQHVKVWRRLARELRDINTDLKDTAEQRNLCSLQAATGGRDNHPGSTNQNLYFAREEDLVGIEKNANKLKGWLLDNEQVKSKIVTVWGMGGAGKTTLVDHVYKIVKEDFDAAAWVTVSKSYQIEGLLEKIARELGISGDIRNMEKRSLGEAICNHLKGLRDSAIEVLPEALGRNLKVLSLGFSQLDEYSFSSLMSFPRLRWLGIWVAPQLNQVEIQEGALESLDTAVFAECPELKSLPHGIEYLTALEELYLYDTAEELIEKLMQKRDADECNEELVKISHIRTLPLLLGGGHVVEVLLERVQREPGELVILALWSPAGDRTVTHRAGMKIRCARLFEKLCDDERLGAPSFVWDNRRQAGEVDAGGSRGWASEDLQSGCVAGCSRVDS
ncbi:hypothetical protein PR202_gb16858 [Eleusine coracana subsp. coracana]|uniref:Uncharacterized protein n=1 Tax=Eleusine coracana subsp. coracana TaxID=191504 RepID=A0AAV5F1H3_ELECO|nr:hypothetical protein PR202_gb16858 [Eleusine coracana subsp. coracana]